MSINLLRLPSGWISWPPLRNCRMKRQLPDWQYRGKGCGGCMSINLLRLPSGWISWPPLRNCRMKRQLRDWQCRGGGVRFMHVYQSLTANQWMDILATSAQLLNEKTAAWLAMPWEGVRWIIVYESLASTQWMDILATSAQLLNEKTAA